MKALICRLAMAGVVCASVAAIAQQRGVVHGRDGITLPPPPVAAVKPVTDNYFGTKVVDDYRWLENANTPETKAWIAEENAYTQKYLLQVKITPQIQRQLTALERVDHYSTPTLRAGKYFFTKRLADENQASIYVRDGWTGKDVKLVDAAKLSKDQDTSVHI
ncbi:MAG TPA: S9 family peptidase, partial [Acidobacteriaceae bacterium]|nr:S9 family peptidase [Acidobacteriaceae bacterium]